MVVKLKEKYIKQIFSVNQLANSSSTSLNMVKEVDGTVQTFQSVVAQCDHLFSAALTIQTNETVITGHIGSLATVKFLSAGNVWHLITMPIKLYSVDDTEIVDNIQLGQTVKVAIDYGRELASSYVLKIDDCSLVSTKQSLMLIEKTQVRQTRVWNIWHSVRNSSMRNTVCSTYSDCLTVSRVKFSISKKPMADLVSQLETVSNSKITFLFKVISIGHSDCINIKCNLQVENTDECSLGTHNCDTNAACTNTDSSFTCSCNSGFFGNQTLSIVI